jgi:hypothetical protein
MVFGSGATNVKTAQAATCTLDIATVWASDTSTNVVACTVAVGVDQVITVSSEDLLGTHTMYNATLNLHAVHGDTINVTVDGIATATTAATGVAKYTANAPTAATPNGLTTTFTVKAATSGVAVIAVDQSPGQSLSTSVLCTDGAADTSVGVRCDTADFIGATLLLSENIIVLTAIGAPVDSSDTTDDNGDGNADLCNAASENCSNFAAVTTDSAVTTDTAPYDIQDAIGTQLTGYSTLTMTNAPAAAVFTSTNSQTLIVANTTLTDEAAAISGLPKTGNFRYGLSLAFVGTTGNRTLTTTIGRTDGVIATLTATPLVAVLEVCTLASSATDKSWSHASIVADASDDKYYWKVTALDSAGNPVTTADAIKTGDSDGVTANGHLNAATGGFDLEICDTDEDATVSTFTADAYGNAYIALHIANELDADAAGEYTVNFKNNTAGTIQASSTFSVAHATASSNTYAITGPDNIAANEIGIYTAACTDLNGNVCNANVTASHVVTGLGTTGSSVPTVGTSLSITPTLGANITVVAPAGGGSGTVGIIIGTKVVASKVVTYSAASTAAAVSGTGCTGATTGSYTCVVTSGGTAAEVATASGAVSVWQSDANGVLQGYVVGTPDFVDTGLASTAAIASSSAIIVVR